MIKQQKPLTTLIERNVSGNMEMEELRYLQLFRCRYIHTVSGWFGSDFWTRTVLPSAATEPAILHAVIALSAAHRCAFQPTHKLDAPERFMLQQYSKAIQLLAPILSRHDKFNTTVILITCQIFTLLEYLRGKPSLAESHLRNCLNLLKDMHNGESTPIQHGVLLLKPSTHAKVVEKGIIQRLATLHVQADLFAGRLIDTNFLIQPLEVEIPCPTFAHAEEAKDSIDKLLHGIIFFSRRFEDNQIKDGLPGLLRVKELALTQLEAWMHTYLRTASDFGFRMFGVGRASSAKGKDGPLGFGSRALSDEMNAREPLAYRLLLNYHTMATIMCHCIQPGTSESKYEAHTPDFLSILGGAIEIWKVYAMARQIPGNVELSNSISEYGLIPPLYYTALKCRVHRIRAHAIKLLRQIHYKECAWDSVLAANIAEKVMQLEEGGMVGGQAGGEGSGDRNDDFGIHEMPYIDAALVWTPPDENLFHDVSVEMLEDKENMASVTCKRWNRAGSLEIVKMRVEGEPWSAN